MVNRQMFHEIEAVFKDKGIRMTPTRRAVIEVFINYDEHMNAEVVYNRTNHKKLGLATVYRTLEILKSNDIIKEIFVNGERLYELALENNRRFHIHFSCTSCGKLEEYTDIMLLNHTVSLKKLIERDWDHKVDDMNIVMKGICKDCRGL